MQGWNIGTWTEVGDGQKNTGAETGMGLRCVHEARDSLQVLGLAGMSERCGI